MRDAAPRSLSAADPGVLAGAPITTEDDVLYVRELPTFGGRLTPHEAELLLQYLTAPYLRVPLLLQFFAEPVRNAALAEPGLQRVVDACLFEPALWLPAPAPGEAGVAGSGTGTPACPAEVPATDRGAFATPCGLLFNELQHDPQCVVEGVLVLLETAMKKDTGRHNSPVAATIQYVMRLAVRVEGFLLWLLQNVEFRARFEPAHGETGARDSDAEARGRDGTCDPAASPGFPPPSSSIAPDGAASPCNGATATGPMPAGGLTSAGARSHIRGLGVRLPEGRLQYLRDAARRLHAVLHGPGYRMLDRWCRRAMRQQDLHGANVQHAHMAYLFRNQVPMGCRLGGGGTGHLGRTETQRGRLWTACGQRRVDSKNSQTTPATTSTSSIRQVLGAADTQTAHPATSSTAPTHQPLGSANAETTPARAPAAAAGRTQRPDATCEGKNG